GKKIGIFDSWQECQKQVTGFADAKFKAFAQQEAALKAFKEGYEKHIGKNSQNVILPKKIDIPYAECLCVDAACNMQNGDMEYRGVHYPSGKLLFHQKDFKDATNNIGEFLAIVHAIAFEKKNRWKIPIYSDSKTALAWLRDKKCKTEQKITPRNQELFETIKRAESYLKTNDYSEILVLKWNTENWGEIPADFGRK
ncbi:MAG: ribonuclease H family protein, partial [Thermonemataceae bacterium]|nr:ribonuclease H family protein [Thermonemataceae bacterium]